MKKPFKYHARFAFPNNEVKVLFFYADNKELALDHVSHLVKDKSMGYYGGVLLSMKRA